MLAKIDKKLFAGLFFSFIAATIIGTLLHEFGHYIVAEYYGYDARISYNSTRYHFADTNHPIGPDISIQFALGGPVQTMLTGTIGFILLVSFRKRFFLADKLSPVQWLIILTSLFWLRQTANFCVWMTDYLLNGKFSKKGDEIKIAKYFNLPEWSLISITAIIGAVILAVVTFRFIPSKQRATFLLAGLTGGIAGYYLWLILLGKYILP